MSNERCSDSVICLSADDTNRLTKLLVGYIYEFCGVEDELCHFAESLINDLEADK